MRLVTYIKPIFLILFISVVSVASAQSVRQERRLITDGNKLYVERKFKDAAEKYKAALNVNGASAVARYNLGMAEIRQVANPKDSSERTIKLLDEAVKNLSQVASMAREKPGLASKANYNLGNLEFNREKYAEAIDFYKQSLRINPNDANAQKNLRIAQLKKQQQDNNKNQENKDQNKDQDQKQDQDKKDNQDQQQNQQDKNQDNNKDKQEQPKEQKINNQTASQILQAIDNKENQTRARVNRANKGEKSVSGGSRTRKW